MQATEHEVGFLPAGVFLYISSTLLSLNECYHSNLEGLKEFLLMGNICNIKCCEKSPPPKSKNKIGVEVMQTQLAAATRVKAIIPISSHGQYTSAVHLKKKGKEELLKHSFLLTMLIFFFLKCYQTTAHPLYNNLFIGHGLQVAQQQH